MSLRRKTQTGQKSPAALRTAIENIYGKSLWEHKKGAFTLKYLRNMNLKAVAFVTDGSRTYRKTGSDKVWVVSGQCKIQLTIFADGSALPTLLIFCGKELRINLAEKINGIKEKKLPFNQKHRMVKWSWRSGLKRLGMIFYTNLQVLDPLTKSFMQTWIDPSKDLM